MKNLRMFDLIYSNCKNYAQNTHSRYRIVFVFGNTNVNVENDRKHCALQICR